MSGVSVTFGGLVALSDVSLTVAPSRVLGVIGPNGAGKTTLFNVACGFVRPDTGTLTWRDTELRRLRPHHLAGLGIARSLQELGLFGRMTVLDNVLVGAGKHAKAGFWSSMLGRTQDEKALTERAMAYLEDFDIADVAHRYPASLPYPVRKRVALARALVGEPELLLLDEPAGGLSAAEIADVGTLVRGLTERMSVMLVEHHMDLVMGVCDEIVVLDFGKVIARGTPDEIRADPAVRAAYLGEEVAGADR
ncbi:ABC transporter ATP-binding protein [Amycolatopsis sp. BJA-103]|uniref:ABC transporter ATP-binding protein n=1 Tax=Amycolatopsis sp. BJA-103 TaxID=1911175 RepID=UPI000C766487|nr:ABC transporter ATP-binding protein [Amycolatopsis sp. BJA-103]AUI64522.1 ABC transporter ATP-binding protein [Amycolatopsis sp. BJA-103]PNE14541.1 ABC transporter ATP-binding protein [Amycolatopsis sp. BJA-103]